MNNGGNKFAAKSKGCFSSVSHPASCLKHTPTVREGVRVSLANIVQICVFCFEKSPQFDKKLGPSGYDLFQLNCEFRYSLWPNALNHIALKFIDYSGGIPSIAQSAPK